MGAMSRYDAALADLAGASDRDSYVADAVVYRGQVYAEKKLIDAALADFDRAVALQPRDPWPLNSRGLAHADNGDYAAAVVDYSAAIERDKGYFPAYQNRGFAYQDRKSTRLNSSH